MRKDLGKEYKKLTTTNPEGSRIMKNLVILRRQMNEMNNKVAKLESRTAMNEGELTRLRMEMELRWLQGDALAIRHRFIDHYKRDVLCLSGLKGTYAIKTRNVVAHHSNAISDALLFKYDDRSYLTTYTNLNGFYFTQVLEYCKKFSRT